MTKTLLDTGPLVAFYSIRDAWHQWAMEQMGAIRPPLLTCEPVLAESCFLLARDGGNPRTVLPALQEGILQVALHTQAEAAALEILMARYADLPMSPADACLVRLSELQPDCRVFTLDRHFTLYRRHGRQIIPLLSPGL
jgi:predicted nucleic acid-binding protein